LQNKAVTTSGRLLSVDNIVPHRFIELFSNTSIYVVSDLAVVFVRLFKRIPLFEVWLDVAD